MNEPKHIIDKVILDICVDTLDKGEHIKNNISAFLENRLFPYLEKQFSMYDQSDKLLRFDKLNFDVKVSSWSEVGNLTFQVKSQLLDQLEEIKGLSILSASGFDADWDSMPNTTRDKMIEHSHEVISFDLNRENVLLYFLERGYLPWYGNEEHINEISESETWIETLKNRRFTDKLNAILQHNDEALDRFLLQFPFEMALLYYRQFAHIPDMLLGNIEKLFAILPSSVARCLLKILILVSLKCNDDRIEKATHCIPSKVELSGLNDRQVTEANHLWKPIFWSLIMGSNQENPIRGQVLVNKLLENKMQNIFLIDSKKIQDYSTIETELEGQTRAKQQPYFEKTDEEVTTSSAGIILLHPFLYTFFERTKISQGRGLLPPGSENLAVQALRYLATGNENFFGGNMVLEKFICGLPLKFPVDRESQLTDAIKEEAVNLLTEVIRQWPVLKNTSPDGLRQLFILRQGKLLKSSEGFKLLVERKAQDVLLEKLHWNYSIVKFPWREELLFVEW